MNKETKEIKLDETNVVEYLHKYVAEGYKQSKTVTIKEGAFLCKLFRVLSKQEVDKTVDHKQAYETIFKYLETFNSNGSYTLPDSAVIFELMTFIEVKVIPGLKGKGEEIEEIKLKEYNGK